MDHEQLISKKELLELTGISYGQLYRWKRKDLIPEQWFIRKSTFTGQETYFPKDKMLTRIDKIINMKDGLSLDELADMFSPNLAETAMYKEELIRRNIVSKASLELFVEKLGDAEVIPFDKILFLYALDKLLQSGDITRNDGGNVLQLLNEHYKKLEGKPCDLLIVRKKGMSSFLLSSSPSEIYFENGTTIVTKLNLAGCIQELKLKI